jgi:predicted nucleotidyltransferase
MLAARSITPTRAWALEEAKAIVSRLLAPYGGQVYLFGSCAADRPLPHSDIDIGVDSDAPMGVIAEIVEAMEESNIPYYVDIVDMRRSDAEFAAIIRKQGILWTI